MPVRGLLLYNVWSQPTIFLRPMVFFCGDAGSLQYHGTLTTIVGRRRIAADLAGPHDLHRSGKAAVIQAGAVPFR